MWDNSCTTTPIKKVIDRIVIAIFWLFVMISKNKKIDLKIYLEVKNIANSSIRKITSGFT
jgi:hypothetical protein